jgi:hypothetical protein
LTFDEALPVIEYLSRVQDKRRQAKEANSKVFIFVNRRIRTAGLARL